MKRLFVLSLLIAAGGLAMLVTGLRADNPDDFPGFVPFGAGILALGLVLVGLSAFLSRN